MTVRCTFDVEKFVNLLKKVRFELIFKHTNKRHRTPNPSASKCRMSKNYCHPYFRLSTRIGTAYSTYCQGNCKDKLWSETQVEQGMGITSSTTKMKPLRQMGCLHKDLFRSSNMVAFVLTCQNCLFQAASFPLTLWNDKWTTCKVLQLVPTPTILINLRDSNLIWRADKETGNRELVNH